MIAFGAQKAWRIAQCCTYILFIKKLKYVFSKTKYASKNTLYRSLYGLAFIFFMVDLLKDIYSLIVNKTTHALLIASAISYIISSIIDMILSVSILHLFITKLRKLHFDIQLLARLNKNNNTQHQIGPGSDHPYFQNI